MTNKQKLKNLLEQLLEKHKLFFKRLHGNGDLDKDINLMIDEMGSKTVKLAINQVEATLKKRETWLAEWRDEQIKKILDE